MAIEAVGKATSADEGGQGQGFVERHVELFSGQSADGLQ